jgi:hypothetical protein
MKQYDVVLTGQSPLLMHKDNIAFGERLKKWQLAGENAALIVKGDDRSPPWTWIGYCYSDGHTLGIEADNVMTMLREGGAKVPTGKKGGSYKKQTQSGLILDQTTWQLLVGGKPVSVNPIEALIGNLDFTEHMDVVAKLGFELLVKRARIGTGKHVRVRPMFRDWVAKGSLTVLDEEISGLSETVLVSILRQAGALCGIGDWRPSSPASGVFGRFTSTVTAKK